MDKDSTSYRVPILRLKDLQKTHTEDDSGDDSNASTVADDATSSRNIPEKRPVDTSTFTEKDIAEAVITPKDTEQPQQTQSPQTPPASQPAPQTPPAPAPEPVQQTPPVPTQKAPASPQTPSPQVSPTKSIPQKQSQSPQTPPAPQPAPQTSSTAPQQTVQPTQPTPHKPASKQAIPQPTPQTPPAPQPAPQTPPAPAPEPVQQTPPTSVQGDDVQQTPPVPTQKAPASPSPQPKKEVHIPIENIQGTQQKKSVQQNKQSSSAPQPAPQTSSTDPQQTVQPTQPTPHKPASKQAIPQPTPQTPPAPQPTPQTPPAPAPEPVQQTPPTSVQGDDVQQTPPVPTQKASASSPSTPTTEEDLDDLQDLISKSLGSEQVEETPSETDTSTPPLNVESHKKIKTEEVPTFEKASVLPAADPLDIWEQDALKRKSIVGNRKHSAEAMVAQREKHKPPKKSLGANMQKETQTKNQSPAPTASPVIEQNETVTSPAENTSFKKDAPSPTQPSTTTAENLVVTDTGSGGTAKKTGMGTDKQTRVTPYDTQTAPLQQTPPESLRKEDGIKNGIKNETMSEQRRETAPPEQPLAEIQPAPSTSPQQKETEKSAISQQPAAPATGETKKGGGISNLSALRTRALKNSGEAKASNPAPENTQNKKPRPTSKHASAIAGVADQLHTLSNESSQASNSVPHAVRKSVTTNKEQRKANDQSNSPSSEPAEQTEENLASIRTFKSDVEQTIMKNKTSVVDMVSAEEKRKSLGETVRKAPRTAKITPMSYVLIGASIMLLTAGLGIGGYFAYQHFASDQEGQTGKIMSPNQTIQHDVTGQIGNELLSGLGKVKEALQSNPNDITRFKIMERFSSEDATNLTLVPPRRFFEMLDTKAPGALIRTTGENMVLGVHTLKNNEAFWIYNVEHYETAFRGMLVWENNMKDDLSPFFVPTGTTVDQSRGSQDYLFIDEIVGNKEARVLKDDEGETVLLWAIPDTENVIITTNETTFKEIIQRMTARTTN